MYGNSPDFQKGINKKVEAAVTDIRAVTAAFSCTYIPTTAVQAPISHRP